jgi:multiple sugar transport system permease protein
MEKRSRNNVWLNKQLSENPSILFFPSLFILMIIALPPLFYSLYLSVINKNLTASYLPIKFVGLNNYIQIFTDSRALNSFKVTFLYVVGVVLIELILGLLISDIIDKYFRKNVWLLTLIILPMAIPRVVVASLWSVMYNSLIGILNYFVSVAGLNPIDWLGNKNMALISVIFVDIWQWTSFMILLLIAGYETIPKEPYEAAEIDGATEKQIYMYLTIPLLKPIIIVAVFYRIIDALRTFDIVFTLTNGGPGIATETVDIFAYYTAIVEGGNISYASAMAVLMVILTSIVGTFLMRRTGLAKEK